MSNKFNIKPMKKAIQLLALLSLFNFAVVLNAQNETTKWYFGNQAGLNFSSGVPVADLNSNMSAEEACVTQSTSAGVLRFYSDGVNVYNKNHALINPNNLHIVADHLRCAAYELPFEHGEPFGAFEDSEEIMSLLAESGQVHSSQNMYRWVSDVYPAGEVNLRTSGADTIVMLMGNHEMPHVYNVTLMKGHHEFTAPFEEALSKSNKRDEVLA